MGGCKQLMVHLSHSSQNIAEEVLKRAITGLDLSHHSQSPESFGGDLSPLGVFSNQGSECRVQGAISPIQEGVSLQDVPAHPACCSMVNKPHHAPHSGRVHSPTPASFPAAASLLPHPQVPDISLLLWGCPKRPLLYFLKIPNSKKTFPLTFRLPAPVHG